MTFAGESTYRGDIEIGRNTEPTLLTQEHQYFPLSRLPIGRDLYGVFPEKRALYSQWDMNRRIFNNSEHIVGVCHKEGIGDSLVRLQYFAAMARLVPEKKVSVFVRDTLLIGQTREDSEKHALVLPPNLELLSKRDKLRVEDIPHTFFMSLFIDSKTPTSMLDLCDYTIPKLSLDLDSHYEKYPQDAIRENMNNFFAGLRGFDQLKFAGLRWLGNELPQGTETLDTFSFADLAYGVPFRLMGVPVDESHLREPFLRVPEAVDTSKAYDVLIFHDAISGKEWDGHCETRSKKTLNLKQWSAILKHIPKDKRVGIVKAHPDNLYSFAVLDLFESERPSGEFVQVKQFLDLVPYIANSDKVITMDSAPGHLANMVICSMENGAAVGKSRRIPQLRSIYNATAFNPSLYGIRGMSQGRGKMLVYSSNRANDWMDDVDSTKLAEFVLS